MKVRSEVRALRTLTCEPSRRRHVITVLVARYASGHRCVTDVLMALDALAAQRRDLECCRLVADAMHVVRPVPTALWLWACDNPGLLGSSTMRAVLRAAAQDGRLARHLGDRARRRRVASTPDGLAALMHEQHRFPDWAPRLVREQADRLVAASHARPDDPNITEHRGSIKTSQGTCQGT
jgi:hypothetical protein